jgi:hypothetical protein
VRNRIVGVCVYFVKAIARKLALRRHGSHAGDSPNQQRVRPISSVPGRAIGFISRQPTLSPIARPGTDYVLALSQHESSYHHSGRANQAPGRTRRTSSHSRKVHARVSTSRAGAINSTSVGGILVRASAQEKASYEQSRYRSQDTQSPRCGPVVRAVSRAPCSGCSFISVQNQNPSIPCPARTNSRVSPLSPRPVPRIARNPDPALPALPGHFFSFRPFKSCPLAYRRT